MDATDRRRKGNLLLGIHLLGAVRGCSGDVWCGRRENRQTGAAVMISQIAGSDGADKDTGAMTGFIVGGEMVVRGMMSKKWLSSVRLETMAAM